MTGQEFREIRGASGYSRKQIAEEIGVSPETVKNWEARKKDSKIPLYAKKAAQRLFAF